MQDKDGIEWRTEKRTIRDLKEYNRNPRKMGKDEFNELVKSLQQDGYHKRITIDTNNIIIGGHGRLKALLKVGYKPDDEIEVLVPATPLTPEQFDRVNIRDNLGFGGFDYDILANNFEPQQLIDWGMPEYMLAVAPTEDEEEERKPVEKKTKLCPSCGEILN